MAMPLPSAPAAQSSTTTLRSLLEARRAQGFSMSVEEAVAVAVPLCMDLQQRHARGERFYVHPSAIAAGEDGVPRIDPRLSVHPTHPLDLPCVAPEIHQARQPGDQCASVFSIGAIIYEMVTGQPVGPAMRRPSEMNRTVPDSLEVLIGKAIIGDRAHRPADLGALASALYNIAPRKSIHPPAVSESRLDASAELDVDIKFSMLPQPPPGAQGRDSSGLQRMPPSPSSDPLAPPVIDRSSQDRVSRKNLDDPTSRLAALKARLESDPRPRYVVNKDRMDHGPFSAVELLQQIASHSFRSDHGLRDEVSGRQMPIADWEEFAPFAQQANLLREKRAEEKAVVRAAAADQKSGIAKTILAVSVVIALAGILTVWFLKRRGTRNEDVVVTNDRGGTVEVNGDIKGRKHAGGAGHAGAGGGGAGYSSGMSYEAVLNSNNEQVNIGGGSGAPDLTNAQLSGPLRNASFVPACGAPDDMKVVVRVAVRMGVPIGVTVTTNPPSNGVAACIDRSVRGLRWPANGKTDFVTTSY
jgi:eukaryotic-like serine/threonine-protein kinase